SDNANLQLLRGSGGIVGSSARAGNRSESIRSNLQAGTYYIQITGASPSSVNYSLSLKASGKTSDAGNNASSALDAGNLNQTQRRYKGKLSKNDIADFFRFDLSQADDVNIALGGLQRDADLRLFNSSGTEISRAANDGSRSRVIGQRLNAGTYFIGVSGNSSSTLRYTLDMSGLGQITSLTGTGSSSSGNTTSSGNPGGSLASAETISSPTFSRNQSVDGTNRSDFYRFSVNQAGIFTGNLSGLSGDADIRLIQDANNNGQIDQNEVLAWQWEWGTANESIRRFIQPGTYYVQVAGYGDQAINYKVDSNFSPSGSDDRKFSIQLNFGNGLDSVNMGVKNAISEAAKFWENVIASSSFNGLHALKIDVVGMNTSERWLASATNRTGQIAANGKWLPVTGDVRINTSYAQTYNSNPNYLKDIVIHEFGHVLGIGSLWEKNGNALVDRRSSTYSANTYAGKAFAELNNTANPISIPVEPNVFGHWDENKLGNELLTPFAEREGTKMPLSKLTIASLRDMGWNVNYGAAAPFSMADAQAQSLLPNTSDSSIPDLATVNGYPLYACRCPYCAGAKKALGLNLTGASKLESAVRKSRNTRNKGKENDRNKTRLA
ncbi:MAG TPA: pre-peptidase C-terminal domain-containing protein, partial [Allocoleopsis sp.]